MIPLTQGCAVRDQCRKKGTAQRASAPLLAPAALVTYREFAPAPELRGHVRAYFSFTPGGAPWRGRRPVLREVAITREESFCSPLFADGHTSLVMDLGATCCIGRGWTSGTPVGARGIGALRTVGGPAGDTRSMRVSPFSPTVKQVEA